MDGKEYANKEVGGAIRRRLFTFGFKDKKELVSALEGRMNEQLMEEDLIFIDVWPYGDSNWDDIMEAEEEEEEEY